MDNVRGEIVACVVLGLVVVIGACGGGEFTAGAGDDGSIDSGASGDSTTDRPADVPNDVASEASDAADASNDTVVDAGHEGATADAAADAIADVAADAAAEADAIAIDAGPEACGVEICNNGIDDNCDGLVDCQDPQCAGSPGCTCVAAPPSGWQGPYEVWSGTSAQVPPPCGAGYSSISYSGSGKLQVPSPQCSACTCGTPSGMKCETSITFHSGTATCGGTCGQSLTMADSVCTQPGNAISGCPAVPWFDASGAFVADGFCPASGGALQNASFQSQAEACATTYTPTQNACSPGQVRMPPPQAPFGTTLCVVQAGSAACPSPYTSKSVYYSGLSDTRTCSACTCNSPTGATCTGGDVAIYTASTQCSGASLSIATGDACKGPGAVASLQLTGSTLQGTASCVAGGGAASGTAAGTGATTICCLP